MKAKCTSKIVVANERIQLAGQPFLSCGRQRFSRRPWQLNLSIRRLGHSEFEDENHPMSETRHDIRSQVQPTAATDQLLQLFARSIFAKANALRGLELSKRQRNRLRRSITDDIRTCGGLIFPEFVSPEVSKAAQQEADRKGIRIWEKSWHNQTGFDKGRKMFHWEHVNAVSSIQEMCEQAKSEEGILEILKTRLRIAWI